MVEGQRADNLAGNAPNSNQLSTAKVSEGPSLRNDQRAVLREFTSEPKSICFVAPTGFGKTRPVLYYALSQGTSLLYLSSSYEGIADACKEVKLFDIRKKIIVCPEGHDRVCKGEKHDKRFRTTPLFRWAYEGKIIDANFVRRQSPGYCPYSMLMRLANEMGDIVLAHYKLFEAGTLEAKPMIVVDEVDKALEPTSLLVARYEIGHQFHLETSSVATDLERLRHCLDIIDGKPPYKDTAEVGDLHNRVQGVRAKIEFLQERFKSDPIIWEERSIVQTGDTVYGLRSAPAEVEEAAVFLDGMLAKSPLVKETLVDLLATIQYADLAPLPRRMREFVLWSKHLFAHPSKLFTRMVRSSPELNGKGYLEVWLRTDTHRLTKLDEARQVVYVTATAPAISGESKVVEVKEDPFGDAKLVILVKTAKLKALARSLREYKLVIQTTSKRRALANYGVVGGFSIGFDHRSLNWALDEIRSGRGSYLHNHYGSIASRATNTLADFDGVIVTDWKDRRDAVYPDEFEYLQSCGNEAYQAISRVLRPLNGISRPQFCVITDRGLLEQLKRIVPNWNYREFQTIDETVNYIQKHVKSSRRPHRGRRSIKVKFRKSSTTVKGKKYLRYIGYPGSDVKEASLPKEFELDLSLTVSANESDSQA